MFPFAVDADDITGAIRSPSKHEVVESLTFQEAWQVKAGCTQDTLRDPPEYAFSNPAGSALQAEEVCCKQVNKDLQAYSADTLAMLKLEEGKPAPDAQSSYHMQR